MTEPEYIKALRDKARDYIAWLVENEIRRAAEAARMDSSLMTPVATDAERPASNWVVAKYGLSPWTIRDLCDFWLKHHPDEELNA